MSLLPQEILDRIRAINPPTLRSKETNVCIWGGNNNGVLINASAFGNITDLDDEENNGNWQEIWKLNVTESTRSFVWMMHSNGLKINQYLNNVSLTDSYCGRRTS